MKHNDAVLHHEHVDHADGAMPAPVNQSMLGAVPNPVATQITPPAAHQEVGEASHELNDTIDNHDVIAKDRMGLNLTHYETLAPAHVTSLDPATFGSRSTPLHLRRTHAQLMKIKEWAQYY